MFLESTLILFFNFSLQKLHCQVFRGEEQLSKMRHRDPPELSSELHQVLSLSLLNESDLPLFRKFVENRIFGPCGKFGKCKFSPWEDSRKSAIPTNRINIAGSRFTGRHLPGMSRLPRFRARAQLSEIPRSSLSPCPQSALVAET